MKGKQSIIIAVVVNLLIRIPRMLYAQGSDGFTAIWEAQLLLNGVYFKNGFNIFTLLGLVPFSGYPIGILLILSFFLLITGNHVMIATLLFDFIFTIVFVISAYFLGTELEIKESTKIYFVVLLTTLPNIFSKSYYQTSPRFPFFALLPIIFMLLLKFTKKKEIIPLIGAILLSIVLNFIHRMASVLFAIILLSIFIVVVNKLAKRNIIYDLHNIDMKTKAEKENNDDLNQKTTKNKFHSFISYSKQRFWVIGIIGLYAIGFVIFGTSMQNVFYRSKFNVYCYVKAIIDCDFIYLLSQPIIDQWFHYGIPFLLFLISIIILFIPKFRYLLNKINKNESNLYLLTFCLPFILTYQLIYSFYLICYVITLISAIFLQTMEKKKLRHYLWPIGGLIVSGFIIIYHFFTATKVLPYFICALFVMTVSISALFLLSIKKLRKWFSLNFKHIYNKMKIPMILLFIIIIFNSMFIVDRSILFTKRVNSIQEYITPEEREIADFLSQNGFGTFDSFDYTFSTHIATLSGWYFIQDQHNLGVFLLEDQIVKNKNCNFTLFSNWPNFEFFECSYTHGIRILSQLYRTECYSIDALMILKTYNIRYFISSRHTNTSYAWEYTINSVFIESLYSYVPIIKITDNYYVWNTSILY
ncbi:MAG: hypothetical protein GF308_03870 [Candidatus Heimdallarchaeota archaeon]|nr:hypothetical protein [Candidatus Heimdallarchaeota archaeon]